jgi:hypothetical protein
MRTIPCFLSIQENQTSTNALEAVQGLTALMVFNLIQSCEAFTYCYFPLLSVSQVCNEDGMEFTLRTNEPFVGRIYTYGFYDRCFFRGNGGTANVLRISGAQGYPDCGTQRVRQFPESTCMD